MGLLPAYQLMIARAGEVSPPGQADAFAVEMKWDGMRSLCYIEGRQVRLQSRNGGDATGSFPELQMLAGARLRRRRGATGATVPAGGA